MNNMAANTLGIIKGAWVPVRIRCCLVHFFTKVYVLMIILPR